MIIDGDIPSRMLWEDDVCVSFLDVRPLARGHALVVPRLEVDQWTDLEPEVAAHLTTVAHAIGNAQVEVLSPARVGLMIAGFEVPHTHIHVIPLETMAELDFANANEHPDVDELDATLVDLRAALVRASYSTVSSR